MNKCSMPLIIREIQTESTRSYHLTLVRIAISTGQEITNAGKDVQKGEPYYSAVRLQTGIATMENSKEIPQKNNHMIQQFHFWVLIQRKWNHYLIEISTPQVHWSVIHNVQTWK